MRQDLTVSIKLIFKSSPGSPILVGKPGSSSDYRALGLLGPRTICFSEYRALAVQTLSTISVAEGEHSNFDARAKHPEPHRDWGWVTQYFDSGRGEGSTAVAMQAQVTAPQEMHSPIRASF